MKKLKILVVDDDVEFANIMSRVVKKKGFNPIEFIDFYKALDYVSAEETKDISACFVDMKPIPFPMIPDNSKSITPDEMELLQLPEKIFYKAQARGWGDNFYFISVHKSEYDMKVLERTGAKFIEKEGFINKIDRILQS